MTVKVVRSELDYKAALAEIETLIDLDPRADSPEGERLQLLALLVQDYESKRFHIGDPDPVEALEFRMEQRGLSPRDLVPYLGSRSKVSEVLARKRPLTLSMIKALHSGLGIPAEVLLRDSTPTDDCDIEWERFPLRELAARGWIPATATHARTQAEAFLRPFLAPLGNSMVEGVLLRRTRHVRSARPMDEYALLAWCARVVGRALENRPSARYQPGTVDLQFMRSVAQLSVREDGPRAAVEFLGAHGVALVIEAHLPRTYIDGAAIMTEECSPVVALTLRHDRIDNFWFTLMHELAHLVLHLSEETAYFDDLDLDAESQDDPREREADELAGEALIPGDEWRKSPARYLRSPEAAEHLAEKLGIHPAIVAGRMRYEFKAYRLLNHLVGHREIREHFPEVDWSK